MYCHPRTLPRRRMLQWSAVLLLVQLPGKHMEGWELCGDRLHGPPITIDLTSNSSCIQIFKTLSLTSHVVMSESKTPVVRLRVAICKHQADCILCVDILADCILYVLCDLLICHHMWFCSWHQTSLLRSGFIEETSLKLAGMVLYILVYVSGWHHCNWGREQCHTYSSVHTHLHVTHEHLTTESTIPSRCWIWHMARR